MSRAATGRGVRPGPIGATFRCFDLTQQRWSIYWVSPRRWWLGLPPVVGSFSDGVGIFEADEMIGGQMVRDALPGRFIRRRQRTGSRAFAQSGGDREVNWTMAFTRITADEYARLNAARG